MARRRALRPSAPRARVGRLALIIFGALSLGAAPNEPSHAALLAHRIEPLPRNAHFFVRERWKSLMPPPSSFVLRKQGGANDVPLEHRFQPLENGRLHELVPAVDLEARSNYELTMTADAVTHTFALQIGDLIDQKPPEWDDAARTAKDDSGLGPLYVLWRPGSDGLVDVDTLPTEVVTSLANVGTDGYIAIQVIDFAGHRLEPREIWLGGPVENEQLRRVRLAAKRSGRVFRENPMPVAVGFVTIFLLVYVYVKRKRHFA